jgi:hypothetical protein
MTTKAEMRRRLQLEALGIGDREAIEAIKTLGVKIVELELAINAANQDGARAMQKAAVNVLLARGALPATVAAIRAIDPAGLKEKKG